MPNFGRDDSPIKYRIADFETNALPTKDLAAPNWILEHAFQSLMWMASVINEHKELIDVDDLFYELLPSVSANSRLKLDLLDVYIVILPSL